MNLNTYNQEWWKQKRILNEIVFRNDLKIILLGLDDSAEIERSGHKNLVAVNQDNDILWFAELPSPIYDVYTRIAKKDDKLIAWSSNSFVVEIDSETGAVEKNDFTK